MGAGQRQEVVLAEEPSGLLGDGADHVGEGDPPLQVFGQDVPTLENTPVGALLDRIDSDVYAVGSELRGSGVRIAQSLAVATLSIVTAFLVWWPAGIAMVLVSGLLYVTMNKPIQRISPMRICGCWRSSIRAACATMSAAAPAIR